MSESLRFNMKLKQESTYQYFNIVPKDPLFRKHHFCILFVLDKYWLINLHNCEFIFDLMLGMLSWLLFSIDCSRRNHVYLLVIQINGSQFFGPKPKIKQLLGMSNECQRISFQCSCWLSSCMDYVTFPRNASAKI